MALELVDQPNPSKTPAMPLGEAPRTRAVVQVAEILTVFLVGAAVIGIGWSVVGGSLFAKQAVVWVANVLMLATVWAGLRARGQNLGHLGLTVRFGGMRALARTVGQSAVILVAALAAFVAGSALMTSLVQTPQAADMGGYDYLKGNLPMLLLALAGVYVVSSFGEEVIYRGFLIRRVAEIGRDGRMARWMAVAVSAVIFGIAHFSWGIVGIVQTTFMGVALAMAYLITNRNLWSLVLAHATIDTLLLVQLYLGVAG